MIVSVNGEDMMDCEPSDVHTVVRDTEPEDDLVFVIEPVGPRTRWVCAGDCAFCV